MAAGAAKQGALAKCGEQAVKLGRKAKGGPWVRGGVAALGCLGAEKVAGEAAKHVPEPIRKPFEAAYDGVSWAEDQTLGRAADGAKESGENIIDGFKDLARPPWTR